MMPTPQTSPASLVAISGAAGGLGKAFAVECASRGYDLFLTDLAAAPLEVLARGLRGAYGVRVLTCACDLTDPAARAGLYAHLRAHSLRFWALINVAGVDYEGPFYEQSSRHIQTIIRLNIEGTLDLTHNLLAFRDPYAVFRIINVASLAAFYPMPVKATYAASKRFLLDFSLALGAELRGMGVTVTALCPAGLPTTPETLRAIEAQGWMGQITTRDVGRVANETLDAALRGRAVVIPGGINRALQICGGFLPVSLVVNLIGSRWKAAQNKRLRKTPSPA